MSELAYISRHFRKSVKYKDLIKFNEFKNRQLLEASCNNAYNTVSLGDVWHGSIDAINIKNKSAYIINKAETTLISNVLISNIGSKYRINSIDRDFTIKLLISHIKDSYGYTIHRLDVKSFYESFERRMIINKLKSDARLSRRTISIIENLFNELNSLGAEGLPRGMSISSALSELMMKDFDSYMASANGVLFYSRFVDDIIILTTPIITKNKLNEIIQESPFPKELQLHKSGKKVAYRQIKKTSNDTSSTIGFDYLGYEFNIKNYDDEVGDNLNLKRRVLKVEIADEKIHKLKIRIIKSFACFLSSRGSSHDRLVMLRKRIDFLSKNYPLVNSSDKSQVMSGIYFNYKHATNHDKLIELDSFYRSILFGNKSNLSKRLRKSISYKDRFLLSQLSFSDGFSQKRFCKFSYKDFKNIKKAWI